MAGTGRRPGVKRQTRAVLGRLIAAILVPLLGAITLWRRALGVGNDQGEPRSVLLVRLDLMGDVVNGLSAAHAARQRWPQAHIAFMAPPQWRAIVDRCSAVDETIALDPAVVTHWPACLDPRRWGSLLLALFRLRKRRFDLAVSIYGPIAGTVVALSGARERRGYGREAPPFSFDRAFAGERRNGGPHETELAARLIGDDLPPWRTIDRTEDLPVPSALTGVGRPLVVAHAGAAHGDAKRWPEEHWKHTLAELAESGATVALVGLAGDGALARRLQGAVHNLIDLAGETSLESLMGTLQAADLVISTDSGPAHLARALGTRVIALHGPTDTALHGPGDPTCAALRVEIPCGPCYDFRRVATCQFGDTLCMEWLNPERVVGVAHSMLAP
ncbi:MAG: glycosyltransferase family 9 protein [Chloroflexi bacterium]|nr:glycosyltransferase family 9 protein [Chloroflexota bacterium]